MENLAFLGFFLRRFYNWSNLNDIGKYNYIFFLKRRRMNKKWNRRGIAETEGATETTAVTGGWITTGRMDHKNILMHLQ
jgi:hypothetical protein